ncbi:leucine-rich repeat neuronal protein 1-like [Watersipora subatra]|uniref:leucine-rich repeat neuronal protein 1-like n=1 Tax=Watersipora subatra TaxID=2589382 RepID=UPI00355B59DA
MKGWVYILIGVVISWCGGEWTPEFCPMRCVCHQMELEPLQTILNAVDCKDRDLAILDKVPIDTEALVLRGNQLRIETLSRLNLSSVLYIDLSNNQLKLHQVGALEAFFKQLQSVRALDLSDNYLETLQASLFKELKSLEFLSLSGNSIVYIERNAFQFHTSLKILQLDKNHLRRIDGNLFNSIGLSLRDLDLSSNKIESIEEGDLTQLLRLERLKLSKNNLSQIHPDAFFQLSIRELYLDDNHLLTVPAEILQTLRNLTILNMNSNPIISFNTNSIKDLPNLKTVSFTNMPGLRVIDKGAFKNLPELSEVEMFENPQLEFVHPASFDNCTKLEFLYLHGNSLQGLDETLRVNLPSLRELSLYDNKIECGCFAKWLRNTTVNVIDGDKIVCAGPHAVKWATLYQLSDSQLEQACIPIVFLQTENSVSVNFGTDFFLKCRTLGGVSLSWQKTTEFTENITSEDGVLHLPAIQHSDTGVYTCLAASADGSSNSASVEIRATHSIILLTTLTVSKTFVVFKWDDTQGSTVISYGTSDGNTKEVVIPVGITQHTLEGLTPDTDYVVCLLYHHRLEHSCLTVHLLPESRTDTAEVDNSRQISTKNVPRIATNTVMIVLIVIALTAMLVVACTFTYKRCQRRKRSKIVYLRQKNDLSAASEINPHMTLEQCYNPTTVPLCDNELT